MNQLRLRGKEASGVEWIQAASEIDDLPDRDGRAIGRVFMCGGR